MKCKLGTLAAVKGGKRLPKGINLISIPNSHPYIRVRDLNGQRTLELNSNYEFVDNETQKQIARYIVQKGDIILSIVGTIGLVAMVGKSLDSANLTENCVKIVASEKIDSKFLYYYLKSPIGQAEITRGTVGAVQAKLPIKNIQDIDVWFPQKDIQVKIASVLSCIDDKIELNNKINENLIEQMQLLYQSLITNCDCSWIRLGDIAQKVAMGPFGSNIKVSTFVSEGVPIISGNHLRSVFLEEPSYNFITEEHAQKLKNSIVYPRDIIFTHAGNIGQVAMIPNGCDYPYYMISQRQFYMRCDETKVIPELVLFFFHSREGKGKLLANANSTGVPSIAQPSTHLKNIEMPLPNKKDQDTWYKVIHSMIDEYVALCQENKRIVALRDSLLPRLMSGELDVEDVNI